MAIRNLSRRDGTTGSFSAPKRWTAAVAVAVGGVVAVVVVYILGNDGRDNPSSLEYQAISYLLRSNAERIHQQQQHPVLEQQPCDPTTTTPLPPPMTNSTNATVLGFATGYPKHVYQKFVGSLRKSGFQGHVILAVAPDISQDAEDYLKSRQVSIAKVQWIPCTHGIFDGDKELSAADAEARTCVAPYDKLKSRWGRFPFLRDRLKECSTCTGPVLITDVRDTFFQRDPFGSGQPQVQGLQVFEEHKKMTTVNWVVEWPVRECKGIVYNKTMLCSGTTIGTRQAMLDYLDAMEQEMYVWMADKKCHFRTSADDQAVHNYLYYSGKLSPFAKAIPNRLGIVHTVGVLAAIQHRAGYYEKWTTTTPRTKGVWIPPEYDITDEQGYILDFDGQRSAVVHQYDRYGAPLESWLRDDSGLVDKY